MPIISARDNENNRWWKTKEKNKDGKEQRADASYSESYSKKLLIVKANPF